MPILATEKSLRNLPPVARNRLITRTTRNGQPITDADIRFVATVRREATKQNVPLATVSRVAGYSKDWLAKIVTFENKLSKQGAEKVMEALSFTEKQRTRVRKAMYPTLTHTASPGGNPFYIAPA